MGYYPIPEPVIDLISTRLVAEKSAALLDPCAGEGLAVKRLADNLGLPYDRVVAGELDRRRSNALEANLPGAIVGKEIDFNSCRFDGRVSLAYVNPPFDDEFGGGSGRVEASFLSRALSCTREGSVLVFVGPGRLKANYKFGDLMGAYCTRISCAPFPREHRRFGESVWFAIRSNNTLARPSARDDFGSIDMCPIYRVGRGILPKLFTPTKYSPHALIDAANASGAGGRMLRDSVTSKVPRPPLKLGKGHLALLLAGGHLNGVVEKQGRPPHVVRGTAAKEEFQKSKERIKEESGVTTKTVISQKIKLTVRYVEPDGIIKTLTDSIAESDKKAETEGTNESE